MTIYVRDIFKYVLKKKKWIIGLFVVLYAVSCALLVVESTVQKEVDGGENLTLSKDEQMAASLYYQADSLLESVKEYQDNAIIMKMDCNNAWCANLFYTYTVRRHIVGGANRTLISVETPLRLCRIGTCRRLSAG